MEGFCAPLRAQGLEINNFKNIILYRIYHANTWGKNIVHKSVFQVLIPSTLQKYSIYGVYSTYISIPPTDILPIYRLNIISETLVPRRFRKYSISGVYCSFKIVDISPIWVNISPIYPSFTYISVPQTDILPIYRPQASF